MFLAFFLWDYKFLRKIKNIFGPTRVRNILKIKNISENWSKKEIFL